ncbi:MAG: hypothetical protein JJW01_01270 [Alphaproteobacteria bacterium]|nr:hypothetical protein [Rickettsiales bacterium]
MIDKKYQPLMPQALRKPSNIVKTQGQVANSATLKDNTNITDNKQTPRTELYSSAQLLSEEKSSRLISSAIKKITHITQKVKSKIIAVETEMQKDNIKHNTSAIAKPINKSQNKNKVMSFAKNEQKKGTEKSNIPSRI